MRQKAFTLIEMLATVALIVLLISLLLPGLARARDSAHIVDCSFNLRSQGEALVQFSVDNTSRLPVYDPLAGGGGNNISSPVLTYRVGVSPGSEAADKITVRNHGILYEQNYLPEPEQFYCPTQPGSIWQLDLYVKPWLSGGSRGHINGNPVPGATWLVRSAYLYSPHRVNAGNNRRAYQLLRRYPENKAMMMDLMFATKNYDTVAHAKDTTWNVLHADVSVVPYKNNSFFTALDDYPRLEWPEFELVLEALLNDGEAVFDSPE